MQKFNSIAILAALAAETTNAFESIIKPYFPVMDISMAENAPDFNWVNHEVHTDDGYILNMFRLVPAGVTRAADCTECEWGQPVFLMHGMGANGSRWLNRINFEIDPLPVALAQQGYDVWIGNNRGNHMANKHEKLDWVTDESEYWSFSFPELARYDLPAMIDTVY